MPVDPCSITQSMAIAVSAGSGIIQAAGGSVEAASTGGSLIMTAANGISLAGTVLALDPTNGALSMAANGAAASIGLTGRVVAGRSVNMTAAGFIQTSGTIIAGAGGIIQTSATDIQMSAGLLQTQGNIDLTAGRSISQSGGMIQSLADGGSTAIRMTASGSGYTKAPYALIAAPPGLARAEISVHSVDVTLHLIPGYTYKIQTAIDAGSTWVDVETGILAVDATLVRTYDVTTNTQVFRVVQVNS